LWRQGGPYLKSFATKLLIDWHGGKTMTLISRITLAAVAATLTVATVLLVAGRLSNQSIESRVHETAINGKASLWEKIINSELDQMEANMRSLARDRETLNALKDGQLDLLAENAVTTYNMLSSSNIISRLQMMDLNGQIVFSSTNKGLGSTQKTLPELALKEGKVFKGVERDDDGKLYAELVFPVYVRGKPVGVTIYLRNLASSVTDFKIHDLSETFVVGQNGEIEYGTNNNLFKSARLTLPSFGTQEMTTVNLGDVAYSVAIQPLRGASNKVLAHLVTFKDQTASIHAQQSIKRYSYILLSLLIGATVIGLTWYLRRSFEPLKNVVENMERISRGDLTTDILMEESEDEIGKLTSAMKSMSENLKSIVGEIYGVTGDIQAATREITLGNDDLSTRTEEQASYLEETAASMEEMTSAIKQNADLIQSATEITRSAQDSAKSGQLAMERAQSAMDELKHSSARIVDIISTIDSIAFQTNLLALNAAVEAARAGDQGRGFAVVAGEVRVLAQRSAEAAKEIKQLIENSVNRVGVSTDLVDESALKLEEIVEGIVKIVDIFNKSNLSAQEQSRGIEQISNAVNRMDSMTQQNSSMVEESAAASRSLRDQSARLSSLMDFFDVNRNGKSLNASTGRGNQLPDTSKRANKKSASESFTRY